MKVFKTMSSLFILYLNIRNVYEIFFSITLVEAFNRLLSFLYYSVYCLLLLFSIVWEKKTFLFSLNKRTNLSLLI